MSRGKPAQVFGDPDQPHAFTYVPDVNPLVRESKEMLYQSDRPFLVDHSKFAAQFWDDPTPFETGIPATAEWYRSR